LTIRRLKKSAGELRILFCYFTVPLYAPYS
jgi:hypothetical protein